MEDKENTSNSIKWISLDISKHEQRNPTQKQQNNQSILEHTKDSLRHNKWNWRHYYKICLCPVLTEVFKYCITVFIYFLILCQCT